MDRRFLIVLFIFTLISLAGGEVMALQLESQNFNDGDYIPNKYTCKGENISPQLQWLDVPAQTKSFALICDDPDAPAGVWVHWVIYNIPAEKNNLAENMTKEELLSDGAKQGINDSGGIGYDGPCPPPGKVHHYVFKLYCLDSVLSLRSGLTKQELLKEMEGHIIEEARLVGLFKR
jgi:Raf kinase inhibitor-like YbhB/YbcL family protein